MTKPSTGIMSLTLSVFMMIATANSTGAAKIAGNPPPLDAVLLKVSDIARYKAARASHTNAIDRFADLVSHARKGMTPKLKDKMIDAVKAINRNALVIQSVSKKAKNKQGVALISRMIINDDVAGKQLINDDITGKLIINDDILGRLPQLQLLAGRLEELNAMLEQLDPD